MTASPAGSPPSPQHSRYDLLEDQYDAGPPLIVARWANLTPNWDPSRAFSTWNFLEISGKSQEIGNVGMKSSSVPFNPIHTVIYLQVVGNHKKLMYLPGGSHSHLFGVVLFQAALEDLLSVHSSDPRKRGRVHLLPGRTTDKGWDNQTPGCLKRLHSELESPQF